MAGRGPARKAGGASGKKVSTTVLTVVDNPVIPPMPPAEDWISFPGGNPAQQGGMDSTWDDEAGSLAPEWNPAVVKWWESIWSSPMSSEYVESDIHSLYAACMLLHESLNPFHKPAERNAFLKQWESTLKNFGLTPSSRETLRWQVAQGTSAQKRTEQLRAQASNDKVRDSGAVTDLYKRHG